MKKFNTEITSKINRSIVLAEIYHTPDVSRAELATMTGLNRSAITHILNDLLRKGLVEEVKKGKSGARGGRCPIHLQVKFDAATLIAVELGLSRIAGAITDLKGAELHREEMDIVRGQPLLDVLTSFLDRLKSLAPDGFERAAVIGVGCPGVVDHQRGRLVVNMFHGWRDVDVVEVLAARYGKPVFLENDANAAAMGELDPLEKSLGIRSLAYLFIRESTPGSPSPLGVGGALILNGQLWHGANFCAGEVSQTINQVFTEIMRELRERRAKDRGATAAEGRNDEPQTLSDLIRLADCGDDACRRALDAIAGQLGKLLGEFGAFLDSEGVLVYIHPPEGKDRFLEEIQRAFFGNYHSPTESSARFLPPQLATRATLWGVTRLGLGRIFPRDGTNSSILFP